MQVIIHKQLKLPQLEHYVHSFHRETIGSQEFVLHTSHIFGCTCRKVLALNVYKNNDHWPFKQLETQHPLQLNLTFKCLRAS